MTIIARTCILLILLAFNQAASAASEDSGAAGSAQGASECSVCLTSPESLDKLTCCGFVVCAECHERWGKQHGCPQCGNRDGVFFSTVAPSLGASLGVEFGKLEYYDRICKALCKTEIARAVENLSHFIRDGDENTVRFVAALLVQMPEARRHEILGNMPPLLLGLLLGNLPIENLLALESQLDAALLPAIFDRMNTHRFWDYLGRLDEPKRQSLLQVVGPGVLRRLLAILPLDRAVPLIHGWEYARLAEVLGHTVEFNPALILVQFDNERMIAILGQMAPRARARVLLHVPIERVVQIFRIFGRDRIHGVQLADAFTDGMDWHRIAHVLGELPPAFAARLLPAGRPERVAMILFFMNIDGGIGLLPHMRTERIIEMFNTDVMDAHIAILTVFVRAMIEDRELRTRAGPVLAGLRHVQLVQGFVRELPFPTVLELLQQMRAEDRQRMIGYLPLFPRLRMLWVLRNQGVPTAGPVDEMPMPHRGAAFLMLQ
ncbi:MAG: hypothetical protein HYW48_09560 [Deltaproteobacteria bacterium]|nr:hypothetical protein [Deltaproteobacteria bacterium]